MRRIFTLVLMVAISSLISIRADYLMAAFGDLGVQYCETKNEYQEKYLGKTVIYVHKSKNLSYSERNTWLGINGKFDTEYIITKVGGNNKKVKFQLTEKNNPESKIEMVFLSDEIKEDTYCTLGRLFTLPLLVIDNLNAKKNTDTNMGKSFPDGDPNGRFKIIDIVLDDEIIKDPGYPIPSYVIKDFVNNSTFNIPIEQIGSLKYLGEQITNPIVKGFYTITKVIMKKGDNTKLLLPHYVFEHSEDQRKRILPYQVVTAKGDMPYLSIDDLKLQCFSEDISCSYSMSLSKVERPSNSCDRYSLKEICNDDNITRFGYGDNLFNLVIFSDGKQFEFVMQNISDNTIKIIWDEAVFVGYDGVTSKVMHKGIKFSERENNQQPSTIIKGAKLEDIILPTSNVYYNDTVKDWCISSMYPMHAESEVEPIRIMLPIAVKDVVNEYIFEFDIEFGFNYPERLIIN